MEERRQGEQLFRDKLIHHMATQTAEMIHVRADMRKFNKSVDNITEKVTEHSTFINRMKGAMKGVAVLGGMLLAGVKGLPFLRNYFHG